MAISLGRFKRAGAKQSIAKKLAKQYEAQQAKAQKRGKWSGLLGGAGGKMLGAGIVGALGLTGFGAPIGMALGSMLAKKGAHELTGAMGMGADVGAISEGDMYGYGGEESESLKKMLKSQMTVDPMKEHGLVGRELLGAYMSAGVSGKLPSLKGEEGLKSLVSKDSWVEEGKGLLGGGTGGLETWGKELLGGAAKEEAYSPLHDLTEQEDYKGLLFEQELQPEFGPQAYDDTAVSEEILPEFGPQLPKERDGGLIYQQGGFIPAKSPTISDFFSMKGQTLGGSNTKSLSQILGRT